MEKDKYKYSIKIFGLKINPWVGIGVGLIIPLIFPGIIGIFGLILLIAGVWELIKKSRDKLKDRS